MKTYSLFILLFITCYISGAQDVNPETYNEKNTISCGLVSHENSNNKLNALDIKSIISRASDFKIYMNRKRKIQNIKVLFPEINMEKKA